MQYLHQPWQTGDQTVPHEGDEKRPKNPAEPLTPTVGVSADVVFGGTVSWPFKVHRQKGWERNLARSTEQIFPDKWSSATLAMM